MTSIIPLPLLVPLAAAGVSMTLYRWPGAQRAVGLSAVLATTALSVALLVGVEDQGTLVLHVGAWPAGVGITLVADLFACIMLVVASVVLSTVLFYAIGDTRTADDEPLFQPVYLVLAAGISASFLTGDLFNLFVAFEVVLMSSYVLITLGGRPDQVRSGMTYVVINLVASIAFVTAVALIYAATGTVNLAELAGRLAELSPELRSALGLLLLVVFGIKAGIFPLFFWLPDSYPTAPTPITAVFAGLLTKVGIYAMIRSQTLLVPSDGPSTVLLAAAGLTMVVGVLGAIAQDDIKRILSFHIVSQIGYMTMGLGLFTVAGLAASIFYIVHHILVKTSLFLVGGIVESVSGTSALRRLGGLARSTPLLAVLFAVPALSLAGMPPFSGFVGKLALVEAGLAIDQPTIVAVSLLVSLLTLFSMVKIWTGVFWGHPEDDEGRRDGDVVLGARTWSMTAATVAAIGIVLAVGFGAGPLYELSSDAAAVLADRDAYVHGVLGP